LDSLHQNSMTARVIAFEIDMGQLLYGGKYSNGRQTDR
jgi:hypothetical protein